MNTFSNILGKEILSYRLSFYTIAEKLQQIRTSTVEYIFKQSLNLSQELNINEFYIKISEPLKISTNLSIYAFKALDINRLGKINVEDFVIVIDSYRDDINFNKNSLDENKENIRVNESVNSEENNNNNSDNNKKLNIILSDTQIFWINKFCSFIKNIDITEKMAFDTSKSDKSSKEINLDSFKRKLKILSNHILTALELNNISDAFDINKNRFINYNDYIELINLSKKNDKFKLLFQNNQNTYPLLEYFLKKNKNIKDLPFRTNKNYQDYQTQNNKNQTDKKPDIKAYGQFEVENNIVGTNSAGDLYVIDNNLIEKNKQLNSQENLDQIERSKKFTNLLKELDVFESGEWSLIELIEDFYIPDHNDYSPCIELLKLLQDKYCPTIERKKLSFLLTFIDLNNDGYFNYLDLINFLLNCLNHRSSKLGWKEVTRNIIYSLNLSADEFFNKNLNLDKNNTNEIVSFVDFTKLICGQFNIHPPVAKQMFDDLQNLISIHKITKGDLIDTVNRQIEYDKNRLKQKKVKLVQDQIDYTKNELMDDLRRDNGIDFNHISLLDKKYYEQEMKKFVRLLQKAFVPSDDLTIKEVFANNLSNFLHLPKTMKLSQFRELFVKPLQMSYPLGIATFQLAKQFGNNNDNDDNIDNNKDIQKDILTVISRDVLMDLLTSYLDLNLCDFEPKLLFFYIENGKNPSMKFCFESLEYNYHGVPSFDLYKMIENFYPSIPKNILKCIVMKIDINQKGKLTYKNLADFIYNNSTKSENQFSHELMLKHLASICDLKKVDTNKYLGKIFRKPIENNDNIYIELNDHKEVLTNMGFNEEQSDHLFLYLSNLQNSKGYTLKRLSKLIDVIRTEKVDSYINNPIYKIENMKNISQIINEFLINLNSVVTICKFFCSLSLNPNNLSISIIELNTSIIRTYSKRLSIDKELLCKHILKKLDKEQTGVVEYPNLHNFIKSYLTYPEYEGCYKLHLQYWAYKTYQEFNGKWNDYLIYKGLTGNKFISYDSFEGNFKADECLNDKYICKKIFEFLSEKEGINKNMLYVQNLIDYLKSLCQDENVQLINFPEFESIELTEKECEDIVIDTINKIENDDNLDFTKIFDEINMQKEVNSFGKINWENMRRILINTFSLDSRQLYAFNKIFCKVPMLFELFKLCDYCQNISIYQIPDMKGLKSKIKKKISANDTLEEFCKPFNLNCFTGLTSVSFVIYCKAIFELSTYESFILFLSIWERKNNPEIEEMKASFYFLMKSLKFLGNFKQEAYNENSDAIPPILNLAFEKLFVNLKSRKGFQEIFEKYDHNNNKLLERDEFLELLNELDIEGLNEDMKMRIINYIDRNNDGTINYQELFEFMENFDLGSSAPLP